MANIQNKGTAPDGSQLPIPLRGTVFFLNRALAADEQFFVTNNVNANNFFPVDLYAGLTTVFLSNQQSATGGYKVEYSNDGVNAFTTLSATFDATDVSQGVPRNGTVLPLAKFVRISYKNGSTATSASFFFTVIAETELLGGNVESLGATGAYSRRAQWVKAFLHLADVAGAFGDIQRTGNGLNTFLTNASIAVTGAFFQAVQPVSLTTVPLPTGASTSANQTAANTSLNNIDTDLGSATDSFVTDPTASASIIALLKGLLYETPGQSTGASTSTLSVSTSASVAAGANTNRKGCTIYSVSGTILILLGSGASATLFTKRIVTNEYYEVPYYYTGVITVYAAAASTINVTVLS